LLESARIFRIERIQTVGIYVENSDQIILLSKDGHYDLGSRSRIAGDMTRVFLDIWNNHRLPLGSGVSTHPSAEGDVEAAQASLIWTHAEQLTRLDDSVETRPQMSECVVYHRGNRSHHGHFIIHAVEDRVQVSLQLSVCPGLGHLSEIRDGLCHEGYCAVANSG
jgi:hypothetical protein